MEAGNDKIKHEIENAFEMEVIASYTLNFLIYIHNVYLNQNHDDFKFPYLSKELLFEENFEEQFKELWNEVVHTIFIDGETADIKYFFDESKLFYERLLEKDLENLTIYYEVHAAFQTWWDSFVGKFSIEKSVDPEARKLYADLAKEIAEEEQMPQKRLRIHLIYDECELAETSNYSYFVIAPIQEFSIRCDELVPKIRESLDEF